MNQLDYHINTLKVMIMKMNVLIKCICTIFTVFLINSNLIYCQNISIYHFKNNFSIDSTKHKNDLDSSKPKIAVLKKYNMKIPVYVGLMTGLAAVIIDKQQNKSENGPTYYIGKFAPFISFVIGFGIGFFISGAILENKTKGKKDDDGNHSEDMMRNITFDYRKNKYGFREYLINFKYHF